MSVNTLRGTVESNSPSAPTHGSPSDPARSAERRNAAERSKEAELLQLSVREEQ